MTNPFEEWEWLQNRNINFFAKRSPIRDRRRQEPIPNPPLPTQFFLFLQELFSNFTIGFVAPLRNPPGKRPIPSLTNLTKRKKCLNQNKLPALSPPSGTRLKLERNIQTYTPVLTSTNVAMEAYFQTFSFNSRLSYHNKNIKETK